VEINTSSVRDGLCHAAETKPSLRKTLHGPTYEVPSVKPIETDSRMEGVALEPLCRPFCVLGIFEIGAQFFFFFDSG
jgi:hypothetical protein